MPDNIILICTDQWRGDCLSIDNHPVVQTPYLDNLALNGIHFTRAYSSSPTCIAARAGLMTGLSQRSHGRVGYSDGVPWNYPITLASEFTRHGYQTQAVGKMHVYPERSQMGFQHTLLHDGYLHFARRQHKGNLAAVDDYIPWLRRETHRPETDYFDHGLNCNSLMARPWDKEEYLHPTNWVASQSIDFLRRRDPTKPFFLFMSFHRPHPPYDPPAWAFDMYVNRPMPAPPLGDWTNIYEEQQQPRRPDTFAGQVDPITLQRARAGYYGHMTHIDHQINRFLEILAEHNLAQNTWLCFISDHGEMMGDHLLFRKGYPYEGSSRIPLILKGPAAAKIKPNSTSTAVAELRDIFPTLLDAASLPIPPSIEGKSLLPIARGQSTQIRDYLHGEHALFNQTLQWITDHQHKYIWHSATGQELLFDMQADPQELHNLAPTNPPALTLNRNRLIKELATSEEGYTDGQKLITGRPPRSVLTTATARPSETRP